MANTATAAQVAAGEDAFVANCAQCHGIGAQGSDRGPALVDPIYRSSHHGDGSIALAISRGVAQHHWNFGPMLPIEGLSDVEVTTVIAYIRDLQAQAGID